MRKITLILIILFLFALFSPVQVRGQKEDPPPSGQKNQELQPPEEENNWWYTHPLFGVSIRLPQSWVLYKEAHRAGTIATFAKGELLCSSADGSLKHSRWEAARRDDDGGTSRSGAGWRVRAIP